MSSTSMVAVRTVRELRSDDVIFSLVFQNVFEKACRMTGNQFQDFFWGLMGRAYGSDFNPVAPAGRTGDMKCDGYLASEGLYFGVHGPERKNDTRAAVKILDDCDGAVANWEDLREWAYVHNEVAVPGPRVAKALKALSHRHNPIRVSVWGADRLLSVVDGLSYEDVQFVLGHIPTRRDAQRVPFEHIQTLVVGMRALPPASSSPDLREVSTHKIEYNQLSLHTRKALDEGMRQVIQVERFFERFPEDPQLGDRIANHLRLYYLDLKLKHATSDECYRRILGYVLDHGNPGGPDQVAAFAIVAYFFEKCDILDRPPEGFGVDTANEALVG